MKPIATLFSLCSIFIINTSLASFYTPLNNELPIIKVKPHFKKADLYFSHYENVLGTALEMKFMAFSHAEAKEAEAAALAEINRLSKLFSGYDSASEFSQWKKLGINEQMTVSKELFELFSLFESWRIKTSGALNANVGEASSLWSTAAKSGHEPSIKELKLSVQQMQLPAYQLDAKHQKITKLREINLIMNSFAKSYIIQKANHKAMLAGNLQNAIINIGGDLVVHGLESERINLVNPFDAAENAAYLAQIEVKNKSVATSGDYRRGLKIGNQWYSHIIDPRTAKPAKEIVSATVIATDANTAGALATAFNILSLSEIEALKNTHPETEYLLVLKSGKIVKSKGWEAYEVNVKEFNTNDVNKGSFALNSKAWDPKFELEVSFNFNAISGNMRRPFVAIWVEDANRKAVRNLALLYNKTKWVPDLRNWYRINGETFKANKENYASVTGATKSPGKYVVKWDGKDNQGKMVAQGKYNILIETSKEHGTDEFLRQNLDLKRSPIKVTNAGNVEISNVVFDFKRKSN